MNAIAKQHVEVAPSLSELAETANREHALSVEAGKGLIRHAIYCGEALLQARAQVTHGAWAEWLSANFSAHHRTANTYMTVAHYRKEIESSGVESIKEARTMLRAAGMNRNAGPQSVFAAEARSLYASEGLTYRELGERFGVSGTTIGEWVKGSNHRNRRERKQRLRAQAAALKRQERDQAARRAGGGVSDVYSKIRVLAQSLDGLSRDGENPDIRQAAHLALTRIHAAEDAIVKALGL